MLHRSFGGRAGSEEWVERSLPSAFAIISFARHDLLVALCTSSRVGPEVPCGSRVCRVGTMVSDWMRMA